MGGGYLALALAAVGAAMLVAYLAATAPLLIPSVIAPHLAYLICVWVEEEAEREALLLVLVAFCYGSTASTLIALALHSAAEGPWGSGAAARLGREPAPGPLTEEPASSRASTRPPGLGARSASPTAAWPTEPRWASASRRSRLRSTA